MGQTQFGAGISYFNDIGLQGRAKIGITEKINALPAVTLYLGSPTVIALDLIASYDVAQVEEFPIYATGGVSISRFSVLGTSFTSEALSLGAGTVFNENIYAELRFLFGLGDGGGSDLGINVGYYF